MDLDDLLKSIREEKDEEIPEGLDDLLSSIRGGEKKTIKAEKVVGEDRYQKYFNELASDGTIDGETLTTEERREGFKKRNDKIGFKQFVDNVLDRKKAAEKAAAGGGEPPSPPGEGEEREPITDRSKLLPGTAEVQPKPIVDPSKLLPGQPESEQEKTKKTKARVKKDPMLEKLDAILKSTTSIEKLMAKDLKLDKQLAEKERKRLEREKGEKKEKFRESFGKKLGGAVSKVMQPIKSIFDRIFDTIMQILLYAGLIRFLKWFSDPDNQKKIKNLFRFLGKFWPALLALYLAFGNGFTKTLLRMTGALLKFVPKLVMIAAKLAFKAGKALLGAVMKNPLAAAGALVVGGTAISAIKANQDDTAVIKDAKNPKKSHMDEINEFGGMTGSPMGGLFSGGGLVPNLSTAGHPKHGTGGIVKGFSGGGPVPKSTSNSKNGGKNFPPKNRPVSFLSGGGQVVNFNLHMSSGGEVPGINAVFNPTINYLSGGGEPMGTDTVPAMLTPGEFVMSRGAVQKYGVKTLEEMNSSGGGTNRPKVVRGVSYAQGGGGVKKRNQKERPSQNTSQEKDTDKGTDSKLEGTGGGPAVINAGKQILAKGYTVAEHPNFRKNSYSGTGANTGVGFNPSGGERVGGHSSKSLHYSNLAIDVTDWRPGDWLGRTSALAESIYQNRAALKVTQIIHDPWGSWFAGEASKGGGIGGHGTHLHIGFAGGDTAGSIGDPANSGSGTTPGSTAPGSTSSSGGSTAPGSTSSSGGATSKPMTGYRKDSAATLSPEQSRYSVNPLKRGSGMRTRGEKNATELSQTAPSELSKSDAAILASGKPAAPTTQAASPGRGTQSRRRSAEDPNNMILFSNRALHNIIL
jgi:hypothetical protein